MKLICIENSDIRLEINRVYNSYGEFYEYYIIEMSKNEVGLFNKDKFISLQEFRMKKIEYIEGIYG